MKKTITWMKYDIVMTTSCLSIQTVEHLSVYKWWFSYICSCNFHMSAVHTSNDIRKPSTFVETLLNVYFRWSDDHLINWSLFTARAWDAIRINLLPVHLSTSIVALAPWRNGFQTQNISKQWVHVKPSKQ